MFQWSPHHCHHLVSQSDWSIIPGRGCRAGGCWSLPPPLQHHSLFRELPRPGRELGLPSCAEPGPGAEIALHVVLQMCGNNAAAALGYHLSEGNTQQNSRHASTATSVTCSSLRGSAKLQSPFSPLHPSRFSAGLERAKSYSYLKVRAHTATNFKCSDRNNPSLILLL